MRIDPVDRHPGTSECSHGAKPDRRPAVTEAAASAAGTRQPGRERRARARDLGLAPGTLMPGPVNAITDVPGVRVGHATLIEGTDIRTGVTAIVHDTLLGARTWRQRTLPAGLAVFNGFGKMTGSTQIAELGTIETPVLLTATLSVFRVGRRAAQLPARTAGAIRHRAR